MRHGAGPGRGSPTVYGEGMPAKFVVVPQWQGSASSRSMRLIDGAEAIRGDLPSSATTLVEVPLGAGDSVGTAVHRFSSVAVVRERLAMALGDFTAADVPIVIGGDCGVELAAVEHAIQVAATAGETLGLLWFDANADANTPATSPSGAFCGMVLRAILGEGADGLTADTPLPVERVLLAGTRTVDDEEAAFLDASGIRMIAADTAAADVPDAVAALDCDRLYIHVDLDVLDPSEIAGLTDPQPFGIDVAGLTAAIAGAIAAKPLVGAGITMFAPRSPEDAAPDLPTILRILSALTAGTRAKR